MNTHSIWVAYTEPKKRLEMLRVRVRERKPCMCFMAITVGSDCISSVCRGRRAGRGFGHVSPSLQLLDRAIAVMKKLYKRVLSFSGPMAEVLQPQEEQYTLTSVVIASSTADMTLQQLVADSAQHSSYMSSRTIAAALPSCVFPTFDSPRQSMRDERDVFELETAAVSP